MKKIVLSTLLLFTCSFFLFADSYTNIEVINEDSKSVTLKCTVDGYDAKTVTTPNGNELIISLEDGTPILNAGAPDLPKLSTSIVIPDQSNMTVVIESFEYIDYENIAVAPSKGNLYRDINPASIAYEYGEFYESDEFYPKEIAKLRDPYIFRNYRGQSVVIQPIAYNAVTKTLRVYTEVVLKVVETEGVAINAFTPKSNKVTQQFDNLYKERFLNYSSQQSRYPQLGELGDMLIISAPEYIDQMEPYIQWKNRSGMKTTIVDVTTIGNTAEDIHTYVEAQYQATDLTYLLLVGDEVAVATDQAVNNNACDHCYGYRAGDDHFLEIFVGRFNGENAEHIQTMIDRTLEYEINPAPGDWYTTAIGAASNEGPGDDGEIDYEHMNNIKQELIDYHFVDVYEFYQGSNTADSPTPGDPTEDAPGDPNSAMIVDVLNTSGASLYNYVGHGDHGVLLTGNFDNDAVDDMTSTGAYPLMIAVACCVGDFQGDFGSGDCLGDRWVRATDDATGTPTGGIAGYFSSILQSWAPPMEGQDEMSKLITESAQYDIRHTVGGIYVHGCGSMIDDYGGGGEEMTDTWCIFGDPSVVLRTNNPGLINVTHQPTTFIGTSQLTFNADVEEAMISLYYMDEIIGTGFVEGGVVTIDFEPVTFPELIDVTATAYNYYPYMGDINVVPASGPYIVMNEYMVQDPTGNGNNLVDFGETIDLDVALKNVGIELSPNVNAIISTTNDKVTLADTEELYGDMMADQVLLVNDAFDFTVASFVEDQYPVLFNVEMTDDNGNAWSGSFSLKINAPSLTALDFQIDDTAGGNGNGRFDNGETIQVSIPTANNGHATSPLAIGNLTTTSPYLTITQPSVDLGTITESGGEVIAIYTVEVDANAPISESFELAYTTTADEYTTSKTYENAMNLIVEDFESGDLETFNWTSEGAAPWFTTTLAPAVGTYCSQSGSIGNNEGSEMILTLDILEDGNIAFNRKVSSEDTYDFLEFYIDGVMMDEWSGELGWEEFSYPITTGLRTFKWVYVKDFTVSNGEDAAWVDEIVLPQFDVPVSVEELETYGFSIEANPNPFNNNAIITLALEKPTEISLSIFNVAGSKVNQLLNFETLTTGVHNFDIDGANLPQGVYFLNLQVGNEIVTKKLVKQ